MSEEKAKKLVLVVDDEQAIANMLCQAVKSAGFEVVHAPNGQDAIRQVELRSPDVIVLDIVMPVMDGWEVCRQLKSDPGTNRIPIIIYSTLYQRKDYERSQQLGANCYITKEKGIVDVLAAIRVLSGQ